MLTESTCKNPTNSEEKTLFVLSTLPPTPRVRRPAADLDDDRLLSAGSFSWGRTNREARCVVERKGRKPGTCRQSLEQIWRPPEICWVTDLQTWCSICRRTAMDWWKYASWMRVESCQKGIRGCSRKDHRLSTDLLVVEKMFVQEGYI